jgi:hypothetical protein
MIHKRALPVDASHLQHKGLVLGTAVEMTP